MKFFHGLRTSPRSPSRSSFKSFHKEYPSYHPIREHSLFSFPLPPCHSLSLSSVFFASLSSRSLFPYAYLHLDVPLFSLSRYRFRGSSIFLRRYFAFLETRATDKAVRASHIGSEFFPFKSACQVRVSLINLRVRAYVCVQLHSLSSLEIVRLFGSLALLSISFILRKTEKHLVAIERVS